MLDEMERLEREIARCEAWLKEAIQTRYELVETGCATSVPGLYLQACKNIEEVEERLGEAKDDYARIYACSY